MTKKSTLTTNVPGGKLTSEDVNNFEKVKHQIIQLQNDFATLAKKPNDAVNKFKLRIVNEKLMEANSLLTVEFRPSENFEQFNEDDMPTTSDVLMMLSQYIDSLEAWRSANVHKVQDGTYGGNWYWLTTDKSSIEAKSPTRYRKHQSQEENN